VDKNNGVIVVISGPSGSGKDTVLNELFKINKNIKKTVSFATRLPRKEEIHGKDYFFLTRKEFLNKIKNNEILEYTEYCGNYYGTSREQVESLINSGFDTVLKIETDGYNQVKNKLKFLSIFILPPSLKELKLRLLNRGTESEEFLKKRLEIAKNEISFSVNYNYILINQDYKTCAKNINSIIQAEKFKNFKMRTKINEIISEVI